MFDDVSRLALTTLLVGLSISVSGATETEVVFVDSLGEATIETEFGIANSGGVPINTTNIAGPGLTLDEPTLITHIGGFLNVCTFQAGGPVCPGGNLPLVIEIHPAGVFGHPSPQVLATFVLSHDADPFVIRYESVQLNLVLPPGHYYALVAGQNGDVGRILTFATDPFQYLADPTEGGFLDPTTGDSISFPGSTIPFMILGKPLGPAVPALSEVGLVGLVLLMLGGGAWIFRRR